MAKQKLNVLDDQNTYYKYAVEAEERLNELARQRAVTQQKGRGLMGKAGAMGVNSVKEITTKGALESGDKAYDAVENIRESMQEDEQTRRNSAIRKINTLNGNLGPKKKAELLEENAKWRRSK